MTLHEAEKQELQRAVELIGRNTRPGRLLEFLGAKLFSHQEAQLTELTIAFEVFGRSERNFNPTDDAVVRVEAHRLRKKLRELYESDSRSTGLQISLPAGTYIPQFIPIAAPATGAVVSASAPPPAEPAAEAVSDVPVEAPVNPAQTTEVPRTRRGLWMGLLALVVVAGAFLLLWTSRDSTQPQPASPSIAASAPSAAAAAASSASGPQTELHLMAGYTGSEVIDNSGVRWTPDRYFSGGGQWSRDSGFIRGTSRPFLFANWRTGEFGYDIPMAPGHYELRLFFVTPHHVGEDRLASFNVHLNGQPLLNAYDIAMSANGADVADEQVFRDVQPDAKGFVRLWFSNQVTTPVINGVAVTPGTAGRLKPIRIIAQPTSFVDRQGRRWRADDYYQNGFTSTTRKKVSGTNDPELFTSERYGHFSYAIPVDKRGRYTVVLHFAEFYHGPELPGRGGVGSRVFHVFCNGQTLLRDFDIFKTAGSLQLVTRSFTGITPSAQGKINLSFEPVANNATVSAIEVIEEAD